MRPLVIAAFICSPALTLAETPLSRGAGALPTSETPIFRLGGAASRAAVAPSAPIVEDTTSSGARLSLPLDMLGDETARTESELGPATFFLSERLYDGRDAVEMGTFLSRGQARAGVSVTYLENEANLARSELFVDYAITKQLSVGLSGILNAEPGDTDPVRQLGVNAEYATEGGAFVQGGVAGAVDYDPVIGLSIGLRF
ncbi:MAG: hypothetical protein AAF222_04985 [Pseudomonadota bacterium]